MSEQLKLRARIRALLARTAQRGASQAEAETSAAMAEKLIKEAGIDLDTLGEETPSQLQLMIAGRRGPEDALLGLVARRAGVLAWIRTGNDGRSVIYFGYDGDLLVAEYLHEVVYRTLAGLLREFRASAAYKRRRSPKTKAAASKAFKGGAIIGLCQALVRSQRPEDPVKQARLQAEQDALDLSLRDPKPMKLRRDGRYSDAASEGLAAGRSTAIRDGMMGGPAVPLLGSR